MANQAHGSLDEDRDREIERDICSWFSLSLPLCDRLPVMMEHVFAAVIKLAISIHDDT